MRISLTFFLFFFFFHFVSHAETQQAFGAVSYRAIQKIIPHATNANAFALAQGLNKNLGKFAAMRKLVNQFFSQNKAGKPNPKTLSLYDNATYSKYKLIALINSKQALTQWWNQHLTPGITDIFDASTAATYKNLYAYFDSRYISGFSSSVVYWLITVYTKNMWNESKYNRTVDLIVKTMEAQLNKSTALAFEIYTDAFQANHNKTYMKGSW